MTPPQSDFMRLMRKDESLFNLFVGGFGSGKSETLVVSALSDLFNYQGANVGVYSPTYDLLRLILLPRFEQYLDQMMIPYSLNKTEYIIQVANFGMLIFRSLDRDARIIGYEHFSGHIDEIDTLPMAKAESVWLKVLGRNRQALPNHPNVRNKMGLYTTPEGFNFTFKYWSPQGEAYRKLSDENKWMYQYVKAPTYSNPYLPSGYVDSLRATYPEHLISAYIEGDWVNLTSGRVYPGFCRQLNACDTLEKPGEEIHVGMDFNVQRGCSVAHVIRKSPITGKKQAHAIFEIYNAYDTVEQCKLLKERFGDKHKITVYPDASGKQRKSANASVSDFATLRSHGFNLKEYNWNGSVKDRVSAYNSQICAGDGERNYFVNIDECPHLATGLETQVYNINGQPDKGPGKWDDINDGPGYFMARTFPIVKPSANSGVIVGTY